MKISIIQVLYTLEIEKNYQREGKSRHLMKSLKASKLFVGVGKILELVQWDRALKEKRLDIETWSHPVG